MSYEPNLEVTMADVDDAVDAMFTPPPVAPKPKRFSPDPKIVEGLPSADYHADLTSVGAGGLRDVARSPLHHWWAHRRPEREQESTPALALGTAIHAAVLEPERFAAEFAVAPKCDRRTTAGKAAYAAFLEESKGKTAISADDHATAIRIAGCLRESPMGQKLFGAGKREVSVYWTDAETGVRCRIRPDMVPDDLAFIVDLKSCGNADEAEFRNSAWRLGYHVTAAFYVDGWRAATGESRDYVFAAFEKDEPHAHSWFYADDEVIEAGRVEYKRLLRIYAECLAADKWPGYSSELQPMLLPPWAMDKR